MKQYELPNTAEHVMKYELYEICEHIVPDQVIDGICCLFNGVWFIFHLCELIKKHNSSNRTRRANDHCLLSIPPISKMCANSYFERSFSYAAPFLWNRLDISIRMLDFDHFKSRIKTELYLRYFEA